MLPEVVWSFFSHLPFPARYDPRVALQSFGPTFPSGYMTKPEQQKKAQAQKAKPTKHLHFPGKVDHDLQIQTWATYIRPSCSYQIFHIKVWSGESPSLADQAPSLGQICGSRGGRRNKLRRVYTMNNFSVKRQYVDLNKTTPVRYSFFNGSWRRKESGFESTII